jgi:N-acetylglutamate synthase-like GNAT family acetyltransferase
MIRDATTADIPAIVAMGLRFADTEYHAFLPANAECLATFAANLLAHDASAIFVAERDGALHGFLAVSSYVQPMSGELIGTEVAWWIDPEARGGRDALKLLAAAEAWARARGATRFQMIAPTDHVAAFYERLGFARVEMHYQRTL